MNERVMKGEMMEYGLRRVWAMPELMRWREEVIRHVFGQEPDAELMAANGRYFEAHVPDGSHVAFVASEGGEDCGCGAVCFTEELPSPDNPGGRCAYLMNIYVREAHRNRGLAHRIVAHLIDVAKERGCEKIYLETTDDGKPVYTSLGFRDLPGMMKYYDAKD